MGGYRDPYNVLTSFTALKIGETRDAVIVRLLEMVGKP